MTTSHAEQEYTGALRLSLPHSPVECEQQTEGTYPTTGSHVLGELGGARIGVWEMSAGCMKDIEVDEYFVVLSGHGTVHVQGHNGFTEQTQQLAQWSVVRLYSGMHTVWHVDQTLRKMYLTPAAKNAESLS